MCVCVFRLVFLVEVFHLCCCGGLGEREWALGAC